MVDIVGWSFMVFGFVQNGRWEEVLEVFCNMVYEGIKVDKYIFIIIVFVCVDYGMLNFGQQIYVFIYNIGYKLDLILCFFLVDMYFKCGVLGDVRLIFNQSIIRNIVLWIVLIIGCVLYGYGREVIKYFELMMKEGI